MRSGRDPNSRPLPSLDKATFAIAANGFSEGPTTALRDWLVERQVERVTTIFHPLGSEDGNRHELRVWRRGIQVASRDVVLPSRPPLTYPLDLFVPLLPAPVSAWFGFNSLACLRGLAAGSTGRAERVVYWTIDFVDDRFGRTPLTWLFERLDRHCCRRADARFEVSQESLRARDQRHRGFALAPATVVPLGAWIDRVPRTAPDLGPRPRVVFLGHLVERQGVANLLDALALLKGRGVEVHADIIGRGPLQAELRERAGSIGISQQVKFHGFLADFREVEKVLAAGAVGVAPYLDDPNSFTRFADPGKLKAYLAAGLPIVLSDVPPNARELALEGAAELVPATSSGLADAIKGVLNSPPEYRRRRAAALRVARQFDWGTIFAKAFRFIGFKV